MYHQSPGSSLLLPSCLLTPQVFQRSICVWRTFLLSLFLYPVKKTMSARRIHVEYLMPK